MLTGCTGWTPDLLASPPQAVLAKPLTYSPPPRRLYWLDPLSYSIQGVISSQYSMSQVVIGVPGGGQMTVSAFLLATLDFKESFYPYCALIMVSPHNFGA